MRGAHLLGVGCATLDQYWARELPPAPTARIRDLFRRSRAVYLESAAGFISEKQISSVSPYLGVILLKLDAGRRFFAQRGRRGSPGSCAGDHGKVFLQDTGKTLGEARRQHLDVRLFLRRQSRVDGRVQRAQRILD